MQEIYRRAKTEAGYNATVFLRMLQDRGALETAHYLIHTAKPSDGFTALWQKGDVSISLSRPTCSSCDSSHCSPMRNVPSARSGLRPSGTRLRPHRQSVTRVVHTGQRSDGIRGDMARTEDRIVQIARKALSDGPASMAELRFALDQAGLKRVDDSDLWQALRLHGIADLEGSTWVPRGWTPPLSTPAYTTDSPIRETASRGTEQQPAAGYGEPLPRLTPHAEQRVRAIKAAMA